MPGQRDRSRSVNAGPDYAGRGRCGIRLDFVCGEPFAAFLARNRYPSVWAADAQGLPQDARLDWLGWDYTRTHDMTEETAIATRLFFAAWERG